METAHQSLRAPPLLAKTAPLGGSWPHTASAASTQHSRLSRIVSARAQAKEVERDTQERYRLALLASVEGELFERHVRTLVRVFSRCAPLSRTAFTTPISPPTRCSARGRRLAQSASRRCAPCTRSRCS